MSNNPNINRSIYEPSEIGKFFGEELVPLTEAEKIKAREAIKAYGPLFSQHLIENLARQGFGDPKLVEEIRDHVKNQLASSLGIILKP